METAIALRPEVEAGIDLLDREYPQWHFAINLESLDLKDSESCVLGQLYGLYSTGLGELSIEEGALFGFDSGLEYDETAHGPDFGRGWLDALNTDMDEIEAQWRQVIEDRIRP